MITSRSVSSFGRLAFTAFIALVILPGAAKADIIFGTGQGVNPTGGFTVDPHWQIVALPVSFTNQVAPYAAYNPRPSVLPGVWTNTTGYVNSGVTNYWMAPNTNSSTLAGMGTNSYNWIAAQTFNITQAGWYEFNFAGTADNSMSFFINGTITGTDTDFPVITNGTKIGETTPAIGGFREMYTFTGFSYMDAGPNTAYMVLNDFGGFTGALIAQSTFEPGAPAIPEPGTWAAAALLVGAAGYVRWRNRRVA